MMKRWAARLHLWLGLPIGIVVVWLCLTGFLLVFADDIRALRYPERYRVVEQPSTPDAQHLPIDHILRELEQTYGEMRISSLSIPSDERAVYTLQLRGGRILYVDPYTAKVQAESDLKEQDVFTWIRDLHRNLKDSTRTWGSIIVHYSTLGFVLILITGLILWWPKGKKQLKARLRVKTDASRHRLYSDLHISLGFYLTLGLLVLSLTGLIWSFPWFNSAVSTLVGAGTDANRAARIALSAPARRQFPEPEAVRHLTLTLRERYVPNRYTIEVTPNECHVYTHPTIGVPEQRDRYLYNDQTGELEQEQLWSDAPRDHKYRAWVKALHLGTWAGYFSKGLTALVALFGASLPLTGYYLYLRKRPKRVKKKV